ncbi:hypothetical protein EVAR_82520_1 [Eumeta japonica]|uniref:Uncharacterized protein n=1 Tax=Eumeta variegata TaxID=151549 RepID=A0A4C1UWG7_EUMVA|nr:hypothetical protein EVAR_82520_1 [Eumeta japonica]
MSARNSERTKKSCGSVVNVTRAAPLYWIYRRNSKWSEILHPRFITRSRLPYEWGDGPALGLFLDLLNEILETYAGCIRQACDATIPPRSSKRRLKLTWWSPKLEGQKRDARTKKWRIQNVASNRRSENTSKQTRFTKGKKRRRKLQIANGFDLQRTGRTYPDESVTLLAEIFFLDDQVDTDDRTSTRNFEVPGVDRPFTVARLRMFLKHSIPERPRALMDSSQTIPGPERSPLGICQAAIFRDLGLFLAMANKCFELEYCAWAWKVAATKVISKPGKNYYTHPKS